MFWLSSVSQINSPFANGAFCQLKNRRSGASNQAENLVFYNPRHHPGLKPETTQSQIHIQTNHRSSGLQWTVNPVGFKVLAERTIRSYYSIFLGIVTDILY